MKTFTVSDMMKWSSDKCEELNPHYPSRSKNEYTNHLVMWCESIQPFAEEWALGALEGELELTEEEYKALPCVLSPRNHMNWYFRSPAPREDTVIHEEFGIFLHPMDALMDKARQEVGNWFMEFAYGNG